jgi:hypothetical protein
MKWTKTIPTTEGFYWVKCRGMLSGNEYIQVAKIYSSDPKSNVVNTVVMEGDTFRIQHTNIEWYSDSPITPPETEPLPENHNPDLWANRCINVIFGQRNFK